MGRLTTQTMANYRYKLRRLREAIPLMKEDDPDLPRAIALVDKLTNQLGLEMTDLEAALARGPGRPRTNPDMGMLPKKDPLVEKLGLQETIEDAAKRKIETLRQRVFDNNPELKAQWEQKQKEAEHERQLREMLAMAQDELHVKETNDGQQATDEPAAVTKGDRSTGQGQGVRGGAAGLPTARTSESVVGVDAQLPGGTQAVPQEAPGQDRDPRKDGEDVAVKG